MKISIIIPAFNEAKTLAQTVSRASCVPLPGSFCREIIVVDDGSTDDTREVLRGFSRDPLVRVMTLGFNLGKTGALLAGIEAACGDYLIFQDADLEYDPVHYGRLLAPIAAGEARIVYGSRFLGTVRNMRPLIRLANRFSTWFVNLVYRSSLTDVNTGFKVLPREIFRRVRIASSGFGGDAELTAQLLRMRCRITEVPIDYTARSKKEGKKMSWSGALHMFSCFFLIGDARLRPAYGRV